jgi:hypothetical protein
MTYFPSGTQWVSRNPSFQIRMLESGFLNGIISVEGRNLITAGDLRYCTTNYLIRQPGAMFSFLKAISASKKQNLLANWLKTTFSSSNLGFLKDQVIFL